MTSSSCRATVCSRDARSLCLRGTARRILERPGARRVAVNASAGTRVDGSDVHDSFASSIRCVACDPVAWRPSCRPASTTTGQHRPRWSTISGRTRATRCCFGMSSTIGNHSARHVTHARRQAAHENTAHTAVPDGRRNRRDYRARLGRQVWSTRAARNGPAIVWRITEQRVGRGQLRHARGQSAMASTGDSVPGQARRRHRRRRRACSYGRGARLHAPARHGTPAYPVLAGRQAMKLIYPGGFVRTTLLSRRFAVADCRCKQCRRATCGPFYVHIETRHVLCRRCYEATLDPGWQWVARGRA